MSMGLRIRLSLMMFFHYFVFGVWLPMINQRIGDGPGGLNFSFYEKAAIFTVYGLGSIIGPFLLGQLADRYFSTEKLLAVCQLVGGVLLIWAAYLESFWPLFLALLAYCNLYMPSMALTNSMTFRAASSEYFSGIRLWGTIGFVAGTFAYGAYINPSFAGIFAPIYAVVGQPAARDCLRFAGVASLVYGVYCFALPHTPPMPAKATDPIDKKNAILESLEMLRDRSFAVLTVVSALIGIMLAFYYACENDFLLSIGTPAHQAGNYMAIGQIAELVTMFFVPLAVSRLGYKTTMLIGIGAWALRFMFSTIGTPWLLMIVTIALHGFCFGFFFVVAMQYVDRAAPRDIKASAQSLLIFLIYGVGSVIGSLTTGPLRTFLAVDKVENWTRIWAGPLVLTLICMAIFAALFRDTAAIKKLEPADAVAV